ETTRIARTRPAQLACDVTGPCRLSQTTILCVKHIDPHVARRFGGERRDETQHALEGVAPRDPVAFNERARQLSLRDRPSKERPHRLPEVRGGNDLPPPHEPPSDRAPR